MSLQRHKRTPARHVNDAELPHRGSPNNSLAPALQFRWADAISAREWAIYRRAIVAMRESGVQFLLGGGFALATYTGRWRDTKDIDFYIHPRDRSTVRKALVKAGFSDYYRELRYDRKWIYRSVRSKVIVDAIWAMANQRAQVDELWFKRANQVMVRGEPLHVVPMEELAWCKLYIMQRDHCDWTDLLNLIYACGKRINWPHLIARLENDTPLLQAMLTLYGWLCPKSAAELPNSLWKALSMPRPKPQPDPPRFDHIKLLDSRAWFTALQPKGKKLEV
jgi:hypothetical protein